MKTYFPYDLSNPQPVAGELHKVTGGRIRLAHIPVEGTLEIQGFIEAKTATHLQSNEFYCDYSRDTNYRESNRLVYFSTARNGQQVSCAYMACGSPVTADDMNEIKAHMESSDAKFTETNTAVNELKNRVAELTTDSARLITEHEQNIDAHSDIRDAITINQQQNLQAHAAMNQNIATANNNATAAVNSVTLHIADPNAHSDIRESLSTLENKFDTIGDVINAAISAHDENHQAHDFLQNLVDVEAINRARADLNLADTIGSLSARVDALSAVDLSPLETTIAGLSSRIDGLSGAFDEILSAGLSTLDTALDAETAARIAGDSALEEKISAAMIFGGTSTAFPTSAAIGTFAFIGGLPYVFDGTDWLKLKGDTQEDVTPGGQSFIDTIFSNRPHANYSALGKADFLTYVFGDDTPEAYTETGSVSKADFLNYAFTW